jgi:hypothetical protein
MAWRLALVSGSDESASECEDMRVETMLPILVPSNRTGRSSCAADMWPQGE